ncbi:MAG: acyl-CoA dehydrogenase family protein, partial [Acidimicrobiia bacterium]
MIDFSPPADIAEVASRTAAFIRESVIPFETDSRWGSHGPSADLRLELQAAAKAAGVFAPHVDPHYGGLGLGHVGRALVFEEAGYSMLGPTALNIAAPDEGNMHMLEMIATPEQKEQFLRPLATGACRSCFAMTEPAPGAGSDPSMLQTEVRRDGDECIIN